MAIWSHCSRWKNEDKGREREKRKTVIAPKVTVGYFGYFCKKICRPRPFKKCQIWPHCFLRYREIAPGRARSWAKAGQVNSAMAEKSLSPSTKNCWKNENRKICTRNGPFRQSKGSFTLEAAVCGFCSGQLHCPAEIEKFLSLC